MSRIWVLFGSHAIFVTGRADGLIGLDNVVLLIPFLSGLAAVIVTTMHRDGIRKRDFRYGLNTAARIRAIL